MLKTIRFVPCRNYLPNRLIAYTFHYKLFTVNAILGHD